MCNQLRRSEIIDPFLNRPPPGPLRPVPKKLAYTKMKFTLVSDDVEDSWIKNLKWGCPKFLIINIQVRDFSCRIHISSSKFKVVNSRGLSKFAVCAEEKYEVIVWRWQFKELGNWFLLVIVQFNNLWFDKLRFNLRTNYCSI